MLKKVLDKIDKYYIFIFFISILLLLPLFTPNYFYGHDTGFHIANIISFSQVLDGTNFWNCKILPLIAHNFGYGTNLFYPNLSHFIPALLYKIFPVSVFTSIKITTFFLIFISGITMYKLMKTTTKHKILSFISTLFYITAPYKIYDYLYRDALAESFVFVFLPFVFLGVYNLLQQKNNKKFYFFFVFGYVGLINSHLIMSIYVTLFLGVFLLIHIKKIWKKEILFPLGVATFLVLLLCLPFIIPLCTHWLGSQYVSFTKGEMSSRFGVYSNALFLFQFLIGGKEIGFHLINWIALGLVFYILLKLKKERKLKEKLENNLLFSIGFLCTTLGIWLSSHLFPWFLMPNFLLMIQFPFRFGIFTSFGISILSYSALNELKSKKWIIFSIVSCIVFTFIPIFRQEYHPEDLSYYNLSELGMGWQKEYLPLKTKSNSEYFQNRSNAIYIVNGSAEIEILKNNVPYLLFKITNVYNATLELPRLYYFGYTIKTIEKNGNVTLLPYSESEYGFIEIEVSKEATIEVTYENTKMSTIGNKISFLTFVLFVIYLLGKKGE